MDTPSPVRTLLIVADDLTGAADCAARCFHAGLPATIFLRTPSPPLPAGAVAVTTDSRHVAPTEAAGKVAELVGKLAATSSAIWYKKIDSTLRGNLGSELTAMLGQLGATGGRACAVLSPAFPAQDRGLHDGFLVHAQTSPRSVHLPTLLAKQSTLSIAAISLDEVRTPDGPTRRLSELLAAGAEAIVVDAMKDDDLRAILEATEIAIPQAILAGSAGLVSLAAQRLLASARVTRRPPQRALERGPVLGVIGSGSPMAQRQLAVLRAEGDVPCIEVDAMEESDLLRELRQGMKRNWMLCLPPPAPDSPLDGPAARELADRLGSAAWAAIRHLKPAHLLLSGGDTAIHVLSRLGIDRLEVAAELLPGMPLCNGQDRSGQTHSVVMKAGNHGDERTLLQLFTTLSPLSE